MPARSVVIVAAAALFLACTGSETNTERRQSSGATESPSAVATTTTVAVTTSTTTPEEAVKAAYLAYWAMADRLGQHPDPTDPEIAQRVTAPAFDDVVEQIRTRVANGQRTRLTSPDLNRHSILSVQVDGAHATVRDCFVDGRAVVDAAGEVLNDDVVTKTMQAQLALTEGTWKLTTIDVAAKRAGVGSCDS